MIKIYVKYYISVLILIFMSCANLNDQWIELGDGYVCDIDSYHKSIIPTQIHYDTHIYSKIIDYKFDEKYIIATQEPDYEYYKLFVGSTFSSRISSYEYYLKDGKTKQFFKETTPFVRKAIIADSTFYKKLSSKGITGANLVPDSDKIEIVLDSIFKTDIFYIKMFSSRLNYWIINKDLNIRFGPFTKEEFEQKCKEKQINLRLNDVK